MRATDQIIEFLEGPPVARCDRYGIEDRLGAMRAANMTIEQLQHYTVNRRAREQYKDQESVFEEIVRLERMADEETTDAFARIANTRFDKARALKLASEAPDNGVSERTLARIAYGMLRDGWPEYQVAFGLSTLGKAQAGSPHLDLGVAA